MGPAATTALGFVAGLVTFLAMAVLGVIAVNGTGDSTVAVEPAAAGASAPGDSPDVNGDGFLSLAEAAGNPDVVTLFHRVDRNRDGKLSRSEYQRLDKLAPPKAKKKTRSVKESVRRHAAAAAAAASGD